MASRQRSLAARGWVPDYHGAWAMVFVPIILGIILSGPTPAHVLLFLVWVVGYFCFFALSKWIISRRKPAFAVPVKVYLSASVVLGMGLILWEPRLLRWAPWFAVLVAATFGLTVARKERTMLARGITVLAGVLVGCVAYDIGTGFLRSSFSWLPVPVDAQMAALPGHNWGSTVTGWNWMWLVTLILCLYFFGTVPVVKTVIRERRSIAHLVFSIAFHVAVLALALAGALLGLSGWVLVAVCVLLLARSIYFPVSMRIGGKKWSAKVIGITEIVLTALVVVALFLP